MPSRYALYGKARYHADDDFKKEVNRANVVYRVQRYKTDDAYREQVKEAAKEHYRSNEAYRMRKLEKYRQEAALQYVRKLFG